MSTVSTLSGFLHCRKRDHLGAGWLVGSLTDENGTPWFVAKDVALALGYADTNIRQDASGRYCLNDLHRAAGGRETDKPVHFIKLKSTADLIDELQAEKLTSERINDLAPITTVRSFTEEQGTFVVKELVYAYAMGAARMWVSPAFHLKVIRAYDQMVTGQAPAPHFNIPQTLPPPGGWKPYAWRQMRRSGLMPRRWRWRWRWRWRTNDSKLPVTPKMPLRRCRKPVEPSLA